jgi:hypothetical protein
MSVKDAQQYIGMECLIAWRERRGDVQELNLFVSDVSFCPSHRICLKTDYMQIRLDRVGGIRAAGGAAEPSPAK